VQLYLNKNIKRSLRMFKVIVKKFGRIMYTLWDSSAPKHANSRTRRVEIRNNSLDHLSDRN